MVATLLARKLQRLRDWFLSLTNRERVHVTALILIAGGYIAHYVVYSSYYIEDAGISFAYARNLAGGEGLVPYVGGERIEGYSNPLWVFLMAALDLVGMSPWTSSKLLGGLLGVITLPLVYAITRRCRPDRDDYVALLPPMFLAAHSVWVIWNASGLENSLFNVLLAAGMLRVMMESDDPGRRPWSAVFFLGLAITRPEGILYAAVGGLFRLLAALAGRQSLVPILKWLGVFWLPFAAYHAWRYSYFAWEWPNTYYAKLDGENRFLPFKWTARGWKYAGNYSRAYFLVYALPLYAVGLVGLRRRWSRWLVLGLTAIGAALLLWDARSGFAMEQRPEFWPQVVSYWDHARTWFMVAAAALLGLGTLPGRGGLRRLFVLAIGVTTFFFVIYSGGDWMKQWRWFNMVSLPGFILLGLGVGAFAEALPALRPAKIPLRGVLAFVLAAALCLPNIWNSIHAAPHPETTVSDIHRRVRYMTWVQRRLHLDHVTLLDVDMGAHMWYTDWQIADIAGLIDVPMARHLYQKAFIREYIFQERKPHFAHVHGGWANKSKIDKQPEWKRNYIEIPGYNIGGRTLHIGNHIRKDIFVEPTYTGPAGRETRFQGGLTMLGWEIPSDVVPRSGKLYVETWLKTGFRKHNFRMLVILDDGQGHRHVTSVAPGYDWYEPRDWKSNEIVHGRQDFPMPERLAPGTYDIGFVFLDSKSGEPMTPRNGAGGVTRFMEGEVWFKDAVTIVSRNDATAEAEADRDRALELAAAGDCEGAWQAWREARWHIWRNLAWHEKYQPGIETAVAGCYVGQAMAAEDYADRIELLVEARKFDRHHEDLKTYARPLARDLDVQGDEAAAEQDWEEAYKYYRDALRIDPRLSMTRRKAEEARDKKLGIIGKEKDKPRSRTVRSPKKGDKKGPDKEGPDKEGPDKRPDGEELSKPPPSFKERFEQRDKLKKRDADGNEQADR